MRLFTAIDLDDEAREAVAALQWRLVRRVGERSSVRWTKPEQMHLTLVFIGEADEALAARVIAAVHPTPSLPRFDVSFEGVGVFPPRGAPRVLWLGVRAGAREMEGLQREFTDRLERIGVSLERRPFHAHLTLARWRDSRPADRRAVSEIADTGTVATVRVDHVTLYRSQLSATGSTYTPVVRVTLS